MIRFRFERTFTIAAPREAVFDAIRETRDWPTWWPAMRSVERTQHDPRRERYRVRAPFGYLVEGHGRWIEADRPRLAVVRLEGDLRGTGRLELSEDGDGATRVRSTLDVVADPAWMRVVGPILRPFLEWNHDRVMDAAIDGLRDKLEAEDDLDA